MPIRRKEMIDLEKSKFLTSATTPSSLTSDDQCLVPCFPENKEKELPLYVKYKPPYAILTASILQTIYHAVLRNKDITRLKFDPNKQEEVWRFFTYMLVHDNWYHLILNVVIQCLIAIPLERQQDSIRVGLLYLGGGFFGALGAACISPEYVIGASAGVYALLISHVSDLLLNFKSIKYRKTRFISVGVIVISDVTYNAVHFYKDSAPSISWGAHVFGALAGLIFGLVIYKTYRNTDRQMSNILFYVGVVTSILTLLLLIAICVQIKRCTPSNMIHVKYTYTC